MSTLLVKPRAGGGRVHHVTPKTARWTHVGFDLWKRKAGELATGTDGDRETCLVFVSGRGSVRVGAEEYGIFGGRSSPFEGRPWSVDVPPAMVWSVEGNRRFGAGRVFRPGQGKISAARDCA
ncbi:MAG: 5-deoxy-glucuronate isomerase [Saprospiraceae bacterium]